MVDIRPKLTAHQRPGAWDKNTQKVVAARGYAKRRLTFKKLTLILDFFMYWKNETLAPLSEGNQFLSEGIPTKQVRFFFVSNVLYMFAACIAFMKRNQAG